MPADGTSPPGLEVTMRRVAGVVSFIAVILMALGFVDTLAQGGMSSLPDVAAVPPWRLFHPADVPVGLWTMSAGILLLALIPILRVLLAVVVFARRRDLLDVAVAIVVLLELLLSTRAGG